MYLDIPQLYFTAAWSPPLLCYPSSDCEKHKCKKKEDTKKE